MVLLIVMKSNLSQKERKESVNKGYFQDVLDEVLESKDYVNKEYFHNTLEEVLESKDYVNKEYFHDTLEEVLESKDYVTKGYIEEQGFVTKKYIEEQNFATKDYVHDAFEAFQKEMQRHVNAILEGQNHNTQLIIESLESKIDRICRHVGMTSL